MAKKGHDIDIKYVLAGGGAVVISSLILTHVTAELPKDYIPTGADNYSFTRIIDDKRIQLDIFDSAGQEDYARIKRVLLICFSVNSRRDFANIPTCWVPEVQHHCPSTPFIIIGCKDDLREELLWCNMDKVKMLFCGYLNKQLNDNNIPLDIFAMIEKYLTVDENEFKDKYVKDEQARRLCDAELLRSA